jgi:hypothetical protein
MHTHTAYIHLGKMTTKEPISERHFYALIIYFRESILDEIDFSSRFKAHRKPIEFLNRTLGDLYECIRVIQQRPEMSDFDPKKNSQGYAPSKIIALFHEDKNLRNLYFATNYYCRIRVKDFNCIAVHIAEYRAVNKLASRIMRLLQKAST